ncbi:uracil-DNA glycosylase [Geomesophilobacter sediminis]|uniref:Uracil-DNA glycosylase n=1 Tax=Geomesophilobacter sediminis TaxID=2798584 RepID=A0A8J7LZ29_9BACT|nr:uracil-DNA glycosylase [Geomesophilobacter sediminis]MBJ6726007.1 uracil-DNA glycosylase [Geomesophilobacter sediminis]
MAEAAEVKIEPTWKSRLLDEFQKPYMLELKEFLRRELAARKIIYPKGNEFFNAFNTTPFERVKVVILGQDPYHGPNQAHGLCFSVRQGVDIPPSLVNIYKEIQRDLGLPPQEFTHGYLQHWAEQGVLLLNSVLSVEQGRAGSHQGKGWETFTDCAIAKLNAEREHLVFMLWGSYAHRKGEVIDSRRHLVLKAPHPSPLSAHRGFFGCGHFSKTNDYLSRYGIDPIDWRLA